MNNDGVTFHINNVERNCAMGCVQVIERIYSNCLLTVPSLPVTLQTASDGVFQDKDDDLNKDYCV